MKKTQPGSLQFCLLIPCFNNHDGLLRSIRSVQYKPENFSILIVDDGSDVPVSIDDIRSHSNALPRIDLIRLPVNTGITKALNTGVQWIKENLPVKYIARLDCGDLCAGNRFLKQVDFLESHEDIDLIGSWCTFKNFRTGFSYNYITPTDHVRISNGMYFRNIFIHPTVMWRMSAMSDSNPYPEDFPHAEDYGFFYTILKKGKGAILPELLVTCEINPKGISLSYRKEQLRSRLRVVKLNGNDFMRRWLGIVKLRLLMMTPYALVLHTKKMLYGNR
jgi:glycosyltransferase involved in cell wall biosynthesis